LVAGLLFVSVVTDIDLCLPRSSATAGYLINTWASPTVMTAVRVKSSGMVPLCPIPAQVTRQYEVARTV
jgi:hypothetical protein